MAMRGVIATIATTPKASVTILPPRASKPLDLLGLEQTEKTIHFAVASRQKVQELLRGLRHRITAR